MLQYVAVSFLAGPFFWCVTVMLVDRMAKMNKASTISFALVASLIFSLGMLITHIILWGFSSE